MNKTGKILPGETDDKELTTCTAWHMVSHAKKKHKAGEREWETLGAGAMAGDAWSRDLKEAGGNHVEIWGKDVPGRGIGKCGSLKEKHAWHVNEATYAGSLAWNPGARQMPALYFKSRRRNPTHVSFS